MEYKRVKLANGLRVIVVPMPSVESATVTVWVATGSRFEQKKVSGISHFLEHMAFKGGKKYSTPKVVAETIDSLGAANNAATHKEWTNYWIKARKGVLEKAFDILSDMLLYPQLREEDINREKGVIIEEMAMYEDTPMIKIGDIFGNLIFEGDSLGWDIIGTRESVRLLTRNDFLRYRKARYYPENMLITVAGGVTSKQVERLAKRYFLPLGKTAKKTNKPNVAFKQVKPKVLISSKKTDQAHLILGFRTTKRGAKSRYAEAVLGTILGGGMSSRIWGEVRERRGLAYAVRTESEHYLDNGYLGTYAGVPVAKVDEAVKVILEEYRKIQCPKLKVPGSELKKAKEYLKGHLALSLEDTSEVNTLFGLEELLLGKTRTPEDVYEAVDKVTVEEVVAFAKKHFVLQNLNLSVVGPYEGSGRFEKLLV